jgi:hypothetical protein
MGRIFLRMAKAPKKPEPERKEKSQHDRAPYQKDADRDAVKSAEQTKDVPTQHGAVK